MTFYHLLYAVIVLSSFYVFGSSVCWKIISHFLPHLFYAFEIIIFTLLYLKSQFYSCLFNKVNLSFLWKNKNTYLKNNKADENFQPLEMDHWARTDVL